MIKRIIKKALLLYAFKNVRTNNLDASIHVGKYTFFRARDKSLIDLAENVVINNYVSLYADDDGIIEIGKGVFIGDYSTLRATRTIISVGANSMIAQGVKLISTNHNYKSKAMLIHEQDIDLDKIGIVIGEDCWLAAGSVILPGVTLGKGVVVGANAVVTKNVPDYAVVVGVPAKVIAYRK
ncbi:acyltransferase [Mucilaginibacter myungsuensis]|uniref:Acyltransferase n=1 Tax=Mucilaginibacter myungsuensis TaxID=649104 RepID=A0A929KRX0_9SPHI|nr:acyltransferase [Mucilaginibacter myungsuensis]MBE9660386.1 acyltransferase [Mucilaginibacter myungsuensis]MDN3600428.1 acyltransferase [Mucilaginibacter myungsuensis]